MIYSPVFEMLLKYAKLNNQRFHMQGHKGDGVLFGGVGEELLKLDVTELDDTDNLLNPKGAFKEAQQLLSKRHKSYKSYILTGGATLGNLAMIMSLLKEGEKIIVDRNCHISVFSALSFSGAVPVYTDSNFASESGVLSCVSAEEIRRKTEENPDAKAVFITSPNSFGQIAPIKEISEICQEKGMLLLVDEAHGAHFPYSDMLPDSATESGADASVVSYHKTMPSLTQSAVLNVGNSALCEQIENTLHMLMTSSSSFLLAASVDYGRAYMEEEGFKKAEKLMKLIDENRPENVMVCGDKMRVTALIDGEKHLPYLRERAIEPEMYGKGYAVFIITACDDEEKVLNLLNEFYEGGSKKLSASSINEYIDCSLRFYFSSVEKIEESDKVLEDVDASIFGTIYHEIMQKIYSPYEGEIITPQIIEKIKAENKKIEDIMLTIYVCKDIKTSNYNTKTPKPLTGRLYLRGEIIKKMVTRTLEIDKGRAPFKMLKTELKIDTTMPLSNKKDVQLKGYIDRLDLEEDNINIIDYKSGSAKIEFETIEKLFISGKDRGKQVFQLLFYVFLMKKSIRDMSAGSSENKNIMSVMQSAGIKDENHDKIFVPGLYAFENYFADRFEWQIRKKIERKYVPVSIEPDSEIYNEYERRLEECLSSIFNTEIPFMQTSDVEVCKYCPYKNICKR